MTTHSGLNSFGTGTEELTPRIAIMSDFASRWSVGSR